MSEWQKVKIGDFLHRQKKSVQLDSEQEYALVTIRVKHKGVQLREMKKGAQIGSKMYQIKKGQFILSGIDARQGAFGIVPDELDGAIVTNDFWAFEVDENIVKRDFFYWLTTTPLFLDSCIKSSKGETQRIRLQKDAFYSFEFSFPPIEKQSEFLKRLQIIDSNTSALAKENTNQQTYLTQLRQAILQEAIEGKLTADWRAKNPVQQGDPNFDAQALLETIEIFWKENKTKSRAITNGQYVELLPELNGWIKTDIDSIGIVKIGGTPSRDNFSYWRKDLAWVSSGEVANCEIFDTREYISQEGSNNSAAKVLPCGSVLVAMIGQGKTRGQSAILRINAATNQNVCGIVINHGLINEKYLHYYFLSRYEESRTFAAGGNQPALNGAKIGKFLINLPPLAEQNAIVERVDRLLESVNELEKQVNERKDYAQQLMQAVLTEAFSG